MIKLEGISKVYNAGRLNEVNSLRNINLSVQRGEFLVVIGANGSGKSTLLNIIAGSVVHTKGNLYIDGKDLGMLPDYKRSRWVARVFQNPLMGTAPDLSILENFRLAALRTSPKKLKIGINNSFIKEVKEKVASLSMGLEDKLDQAIGSLSGGQRQALTLLMSVMDDLSVLLLDEPTAALDPRSAELVMKTAGNLIKDFNLTALMVTHNLKESLAYGSRLIQMSEGQIVRDVTSEEKQRLQASDIYEWFM
ncbi:ABC transporter ATP-binding protein [Desertivirga xinjiangensis]|uniref:ABC transporter ATP-binding protein n=1 Tax=Desertivirga xinjiangensis TaxID=539206 RepID=UPI00210C6CB6|nr:ATP-binding cassette domain-containing protein [Pedobacter xinjiangensis]